MNRLFSFLLASVALAGFQQTALSADPSAHSTSNSGCCGCKVCKLVCEQKKLTVTCYGCKCKDICIPGRSLEGCKHCATCSGGPAKCGECPPKCEFCWRNWFPCGCAEPRTIHVLTKYQAERKIPWYHWEVVDAGTLNPSCCDCITDINADSPKPQSKNPERTIYKPAPASVQIGDQLEITNEERVKLAAMFETDSFDGHEITDQNSIAKQ